MQKVLLALREPLPSSNKKQTAESLYDLEHMPIYWHQTTFRTFQCESGCFHCCLRPFFFPSEVEQLSDTAKAALTYLGNPPITIPKPLEGVEGTCAFFNKDQDPHCAIFPNRPLRCRLYPYLPIVEKNRITIVLEPFLSRYKKSMPCYGVGKGSDISTDIESLSREFIALIVREYPFLLELYAMDDVESSIDYSIVTNYERLRNLSWQRVRPIFRRRAEKMLRMQSLQESAQPEAVRQVVESQNHEVPCLCADELDRKKMDIHIGEVVQKESLNASENPLFSFSK